MAALWRRDTRVFFRTTSQWTQLLLIGALVVVYVFNFKHFRTLMEAGHVGPTFLFFLNYLLSVATHALPRWRGARRLESRES